MFCRQTQNSKQSRFHAASCWDPRLAGLQRGTTSKLSHFHLRSLPGNQASSANQFKNRVQQLSRRSQMRRSYTPGDHWTLANKLAWQHTISHHWPSSCCFRPRNCNCFHIPANGSKAGINNWRKWTIPHPYMPLKSLYFHLFSFVRRN